MTSNISVVIPLYNKEHEIESSLLSVLTQSHLPLEIIVVNDGSCDQSLAVVERIAAQNSLIKIIDQPNAGVSVARNKGIATAQGDFIALLDGDDHWQHNFLEQMERLIALYPNCGMYCSGFSIIRPDTVAVNDTSLREGVLDNFFQTAMSHTITNASGVVIPQQVFSHIGGFPPGMKLGEDLFMWAKIAINYPVCYTPQRLSTVNITAQNRSASSYKMEQTAHSFAELYREGDYWLNEYLAWAEIGRATTFSIHGYTSEAKAIEREYNYARHYRRGWLRLWVINRLPVKWRKSVNDFYKKMAWTILGRGGLG